MAENQELVPQTGADLLPTVPQAQNLLMNTKALAMISRLADRYANSSMVPDTYKGKPDNCFLALELAARMDVSPILVMQNLYIVQGKPSWAGQACKALIDGSRKFVNSEYVMTGNANDGTRGCYLQAVNVKTGKIVKGTEITMKMAQDEGWAQKNGSKWRTMPEQMLKYRAAAFFARTECPEVLMGFQTADEVADIKGEEVSEKQKVVITLEDN
jgi:Rps23 Pro-64 3,4-dihydroxylase Tpa1-like proline 4-hydroxylase